MNATKIEPSTCYFIPLSSLRDISPATKQLIRLFHEFDHTFITYGDANRTMIDISLFQQILQQVIDANDGITTWHGKHTDGYDDIANVVDEYRDEVYIDLEN